MNKCINCGYELHPEDESAFTPATECPKCHAIYEKDKRWLLDKEYKEAENWLIEKEKRKGYLGEAGQSREQNALAPQSSSIINKKNCPYCAEEIKHDAVKCRYCGEWLDSLPTRTANAIINTVSKDIKDAKYGDTGRVPTAGKSFTGWIFIIVGIIVGGVIGSLIAMLIGFGGKVLGFSLMIVGAWIGREYHETIKKKLEKQKPSPSSKLQEMQNQRRQ